MPNAHPPRSTGNGLPYRAIVVATLVIAVLLLGRLWWIPAHASHSVNEGWNAAQAMRSLGPGSLYPPPDMLTANNYPPLSFLVIGALGRWTGDLVVTGRIMALLAQFATGLAVCVLVRRLAADRYWIAFGGIVFAGYAVTLLRPYLAMNDPQWLGLAAMTWALVLIVPGRAGGRVPIGRIVAAAALVIAGSLVKHNLVALPLAATIWLAITDRRSFAVWMAALVPLGAIAMTMLFAIWGPTVFIDVLAPARSYSPVRMAAKGAPLFLALLPVALAARHAWHARRDDPRLLLPILALAVALPIGIVQRAGNGVNVNAFFDTIIAGSVLAPVALARCRTAPAGWIAATLSPIVCLLPAAAIDDIRDITGRDAAIAASAPFIAAIAAARGPVACDDQAICYWAGRESGLDFFSVNQRLLQGDAKALAPALARGDFALIQMRADNPGWRANRLLPAIHARYRVLYRDRGVELLEPDQAG